jgi:hypothetical protein
VPNIESNHSSTKALSVYQHLVTSGARAAHVFRTDGKLNRVVCSAGRRRP